MANLVTLVGFRDAFDFEDRSAIIEDRVGINELALRNITVATLEIRSEHLKRCEMDSVGPFHLGTCCLRQDVRIINRFVLG